MIANRTVCSDLLRAAAYAAHKHRLGPHRKGAEAVPYINHPLAVANLLASEAGIDDVAVLQAALLHDVVEDTGTPLSEVEEQFGAVVAGLVEEVTDDKRLPPQERKRLQVVNAAGKSAGAAWIKAADKTCNLREIVAAPPPWDLAQKLAYFDHAAQVVRQLPHLPARLRELFEQAYARRSAIAVSEAPIAIASDRTNQKERE